MVPSGAKTIGRILTKAIDLVGLAGQGFNAKLFQPTGAITALQARLDLDSIGKVGHWKYSETFENHYIHAQPVPDFTDLVLGIKH